MTTAVAVTYQAGEKRGQLRTVLLASARHSVVLMPSGRLEILVGELLHGQQCRHQFWDEALGLDPADNTFSVPAELVTQVREVGPVKIKKGCRK